MYRRSFGESLRGPTAEKLREFERRAEAQGEAIAMTRKEATGLANAAREYKKAANIYLKLGRPGFDVTQAFCLI